MGWEIVLEEQEAGVSGFKVSADNRDKPQQVKQYADLYYFALFHAFHAVGQTPPRYDFPRRLDFSVRVSDDIFYDQFPYGGN